MQPFNHLTDTGLAHMVDVGGKQISQREAIAECTVVMSPAASAAIRDNSVSKGDVLQIATIAGIQAAKQTSHWIPLCHSLALEHVGIKFDWAKPDELNIQVTVRTHGRTGVEMEALTAAAAASLTVYDMCKSIDRSMKIQDLQLLAKSGGSHGPFRRT